jgi:hypothetical protein
MEQIGNKMAVLFPNVSIASFLNPQIREEACYAKLSKNRKKDHIYGYVFNATFDRVEERWKRQPVHEPESGSPLFRDGFPGGRVAQPPFRSPLALARFPLEERQELQR